MSKPRTFFITGTDTDAGKTVITCALLEKARQSGLSTAGIKPVASGCELLPEGLRNDDAMAISRSITVPMTYDEINPVAFQPAIAPHIAAAQINQPISVEHLVTHCQKILTKAADLTLIEGAGGWRVPLDPKQKSWLSDLPYQLDIPVILVTGMKLGCINHSVLTAETIIQDGLKLSGWIANQTTDHMDCLEENIDTLKQLMPAPFLGQIPCMKNPDPAQIATHFSQIEKSIFK